jgi:hypothetical protein
MIPAALRRRSRIDVRALSIRVSRPPAVAFLLTTSSETERGDRR